MEIPAPPRPRLNTDTPQWGDTPLEQVVFRGRSYHIKRDDLLQPYPGNKARKLEGLLGLDWSGIRELRSEGGQQSNAMLALARFARDRGVEFCYHTRTLPDWLRRAPSGNLAEALALGMRLVEQPPPHPDRLPSHTLWIPQGISMPLARLGLHRLAHELNQAIHQQALTNPILFLPSGTGASAYYLQQRLSAPLYTTPCVGDGAYLRRQWAALGPPPYPQLLEPPRKPVFARPEAQHLALWQQLAEHTGITFDLLYDPPGWTALLGLDHPGEILYIHCGGIEGNRTMLARYQRLAAQNEGNLKPP